jgi:hypothetical protein
MIEKNLKIGGIFRFEHVRNGEVIDTWEEPNLVVDEGLNYALDASFSGGTPITSWFVGIYKNNYTPIAANVMATFPGAGVANEANSEYSETTRPAWTEAGVSSKTITNSASPAVFTFASGVSIYGAFLSSSSVKAGTSGTLGAASKFSAVRTMLTADKLNITYTLTISST